LYFWRNLGRIYRLQLLRGYDVLTGVCTALLGQSADPYQAASIGAWVCGRAAEIALTHGGQSAESLTPTDVLNHLGRAFDSLRAGDF